MFKHKNHSFDEPTRPCTAAELASPKVPFQTKKDINWSSNLRRVQSANKPIVNYR